MINTKKLLQMARKWQKLAVASRKRLSWPKPVPGKGYFVVYTMDGRRFMIPLTYLKSEILKELFRMAEEEFGVPSDCPITLPCDSTFMQYAISMLQRHATKDTERALQLYSQQDQISLQLLIPCF